MNFYSASVLVFFFLQFYHVSSTQCDTDADCRYGKCDYESGQCLCSQNCLNFAQGSFDHLLICSSRHSRITSLCIELDHACTDQENYQLIDVQIDSLDDNSCAIGGSNTKEFCEDQTHCSGNGICLQFSGRPESKHCRCKSSHNGSRCQNRKIVRVARSLLERLRSKTKKVNSDFS